VETLSPERAIIAEDKRKEINTEEQETLKRKSHLVVQSPFTFLAPVSD
jgi:hypothetical protein